VFLELAMDAETPPKARSKLLFIFLGASVLSLIMTFLLLAAAVYVY
jgi:flagellar basal body-associated protein FliL